MVSRCRNLADGPGCLRTGSRFCGWVTDEKAIKRLMKKFCLAFVVALLPTFVVAAEKSGQQAMKPVKSGTPQPIKSNPCAQYGAGFVQVGSTSTCMKVGVGVTFEGGGRR